MYEFASQRLQCRRRDREPATNLSQSDIGLDQADDESFPRRFCGAFYGIWLLQISRFTTTANQGKATQKCSQRRRKRIFGILVTHFNYTRKRGSRQRHFMRQFHTILQNSRAPRRHSARSVTGQTAAGRLFRTESIRRGFRHIMRNALPYPSRLRLINGRFRRCSAPPFFRSLAVHSPKSMIEKRFFSAM